MENLESLKIGESCSTNVKEEVRLEIDTDNAAEKAENSTKLNMKGFMFAVASHILYSFGGPVIKILYDHNPGISEYEIIYWKSISMLLFNYIYIRKVAGTTPLSVKSAYRNVIVFRALIGYWGLQGPWAAIKHIPVSLTICIVMTLPIFTALLACFFLKEKIS